MLDLDRLRIAPGSRVDLDRHDPRDDAGLDDKSLAEALIARNAERLDELQARLFAEADRSLLVVLQGLDTAGKDGTARAVFTGVSPLAIETHAFGVPGPHEAAHDYLWRVHSRVPARGRIGVFNRSHYEDVLVVRVEGLVSEDRWRRRYDHINDFERMLVDEGTTIVKCFLHISPEEQLERLQSRIEVPRKNWKVKRSDFETRARWWDYKAAYEDLLSRCSTDHAPWHVVPSDRKWARNAIVSEIVCRTLEGMDPTYPRSEHDLDEIRELAKASDPRPPR
jgi:PPK2 family polyphosphate:nucleotide phosphotransferase